MSFAASTFVSRDTDVADDKLEISCSDFDVMSVLAEVGDVFLLEQFSNYLGWYLPTNGLRQRVKLDKKEMRKRAASGAKNNIIPNITPLSKRIWLDTSFTGRATPSVIMGHNQDAWFLFWHRSSPSTSLNRCNRPVAPNQGRKKEKKKKISRMTIS